MKGCTEKSDALRKIDMTHGSCRSIRFFLFLLFNIPATLSFTLAIKMKTIELRQAPEGS